MKLPIIIIFSSILSADLISPSDGAILNYIHVLFEWEQTPNTDYYNLEIAEDINFSNIVFNTIDSTLCYIEKNHLEWNKEYFWRINSFYSSGLTSNWSDVYSFRTSEQLSNSNAIIIDHQSTKNGITIFGAFFNYFSAAIDSSGKEIWNSGSDNFVYYSSNEVGNLFGCSLIQDAENNLPGKEISFDGTQVWNEPNDNFLHHDIIRLPNGNYLGLIETSSLGPIPIGEWSTLFQNLGFQADGIVPEIPWVGDKIVEWDKNSKEVVWSWNTFDHFDMSDYDEVGGTWNEAYFNLHYDWTHANAIIFDEHENVIYLSSRHLSRITKIDYSTGNIIWNLGHQMNSGDVTLGNDIGFSFQHSLQLLENGNLLTFDNGNLSQQFRGTDVPISRAIEIAISNESASVEWSYDLPEDLFGFASGNAQKLDNGNVLITTVGGGGRSLEVNNDREIVWEGLYNLSLPDGAVYRGHRIPGIHPYAFSIKVKDLSENNGIPEVYIPLEDPQIITTLFNESNYLMGFKLDISDSAGWFSNEILNVFLEPNSRQDITFSANIMNSTGTNNIELNIEPIGHPHKKKIISMLVSTAQMSFDENISPNNFSILKTFPNPFNPKTLIQFQTTLKQKNLLEIYDLNGYLIETIINKVQPAGIHKINWFAGDYSSGIYFIKLTTESSSVSKKIMLIK